MSRSADPEPNDPVHPMQGMAVGCRLMASLNEDAPLET